MWIGSIRLVVQTKDATDAGTDHVVVADLRRDGASLPTLKLDHSDADDLERGSVGVFDYFGLPRRNDQTPELPPGIGQSPMPYPDHGFEFSHGLHGHLKMRLRIKGDDMWIKDNVDLYVREVRRVATSFDTEAWDEDDSWTYVGTWSQDVAMSTDSDEGVETWNLVLT